MASVPDFAIAEPIGLCPSMHLREREREREREGGREGERAPESQR